MSKLTAQKRALLQQMLQKKGIDKSSDNTISKQTSVAPPASFLQEGLWFLDQFDPGQATYNVPGATKITGPLNHRALEKTLQEIIRRHETMRTTFENKLGRPVQIIAKEHSFKLPLVALSETDAESQMNKVSALATEEARRPFDLAKGPLFRAFLIKISSELHILVFNIHHIITDGWSMGVFTRELFKLYEAFSQNKSAPLEELPIQFADFAVWQRNWLRGETLEKQLSFWRKQLNEPLPVLELPPDKPRPAFQSGKGGHETLVLPRLLSVALRKLTQREDTTLFELLLAAFNLLLCLYSKQYDIVVGSPVANRNQKELELLIGYFVNMIPLRADLTGDPTFVDLVKRIRQVTMDAYAHRDLPFGKLVEELNIKRDPSRNPVFQTEFILLTQEHAPAIYGYGFRSPIKKKMQLADLTLEPVEVESGVAKFDLVVLLWDVDDGISGTFEYNTDLFESATIKKMITHFEKLLHSIASNPDLPISKYIEQLPAPTAKAAPARSAQRKQLNLKKISQKRRNVVNRIEPEV